MMPDPRTIKKIKILSKTEYVLTQEIPTHDGNKEVPWNIDLSDAYDYDYTDQVFDTLSSEERVSILSTTLLSMEDISELINIEDENGVLNVPERDLVYKNLSWKKVSEIRLDDE